MQQESGRKKRRPGQRVRLFGPNSMCNVEHKIGNEKWGARDVSLLLREELFRFFGFSPQLPSAVLHTVRVF